MILFKELSLLVNDVVIEVDFVFGLNINFGFLENKLISDNLGLSMLIVFIISILSLNEDDFDKLSK